MKSQSNRPDISEIPPYRLGRHWNTIQAYLHYLPGFFEARAPGQLSFLQDSWDILCALCLSAPLRETFNRGF